MNKKDIITEYNAFLKKHKLQPSDFVIGAGGACLMIGLRETTDDMDMGLKQSLYEEMKDSGKYKTSEFHGIIIVEYSKNIDLHPQEDGQTVMVDGVCCWSPQRVLDFKLKLNRPKDQKDIMALRKYIKENRIVLEMLGNISINW